MSTYRDAATRIRAVIIIARVCFRVRVDFAVHSHWLLSRGLRLLDIATHHYGGKICLLVPFLENPYKDASQHRPRNWSKEETSLNCTTALSGMAVKESTATALHLDL